MTVVYGERHLYFTVHGANAAELQEAVEQHLRGFLPPEADAVVVFDAKPVVRTCGGDTTRWEANVTVAWG